MALSLVNNVASLTSQNNLARSNITLSKSLERLSSGLKVNRGADGPAALVISEQQRAQISGLQTALDNTNKAVSLVQTGEGALNEINSLLTKARSLALDSSNVGVNDTTALEANQAEIKNLLETINQIATTTEFGKKNLFVISAVQNANPDQVTDSPAPAPVNEFTFQIGTNAGQTATLKLQAVTTDVLGVGASDKFASLSEIDLSDPYKAQDALKVIDQAISNIANQRATLGAFQSNTLESNASNLRASLENTTKAESVIRDTDFAQEIANFTRTQVQLQAGATVLGNANQIPQLVASLLRG